MWVLYGCPYMVKAGWLPICARIGRGSLYRVEVGGIIESGVMVHVDGLPWLPYIG